MTKELQVKEEQVPEYLSEFADKGDSDIGVEMIQRSFLQMAHDSSKEGIKFGDFYDSVTGESFGNEVIVTVCKIDKCWKKFNEKFQLEATSHDGLFWDSGDRLTAYEKWKNMFIEMHLLIKDGGDLPLTISFKSTSLKTGKNMATTISRFVKGKNEPIFARSYTLYTKEASNGPKKFSVCDYKLNSGFNDKETMLKASKIREMINKYSPQQDEMYQEEPDIQFNGGTID